MAKMTKNIDDLTEEELNEMINSEDEVVDEEENPVKEEEVKEEVIDEEKLDVEDTSDLDRELEEAANKPKVYRDQEDKYEIEKEEPQVKVREEISVLPLKEKLKQEKLAEKEKKQMQKAREKMVKEHRKAMLKNPEKLIRYETDPELGLPTETVEKRILDNLVNQTNTKKSRSIASIIFSNIFTFFNMLCIAIGAILIAVAIMLDHNAVKDLVFLVVITANTVIGIIQEIRAKKTIDRLSLMSAPTAIVKRDGKNREVAINEVVLDDLLLLDGGKQICADSIVVDGQIEVNESLITGEADAIVKKPGDLLYSGSFVVSGKCAARVDKIGSDNYIEKLTNQAKNYKKPKSDLMISLKWIIRVMAVLIIPIGAILFWLMWSVNGNDLAFSIRKTAGAMIGMIPSGLFLCTSIALALGVVKLAQRNVLVQELYCIEMLARVNCICLDKTGTITDGTMSVKNVIDYNSVYGLITRNVISAMLNALQDENLTSKALIEKFGLGKRMKHIAAIPFSSQRKYQAVTFDKYGTFVLGAPEFVLKEHFKTIQHDVDKYAALGYRVLCLAHKEGIIVDGKLPESAPVVVSLILIEDNIRPDAINTIKYFRDSGVQVRVISGDNPITVSKISQRAGVENADKYISLDGMGDSDVIKIANKYTVFGRVSPGQKKILVEALKASGLTVAMTGDGVNDILALREADCSIAVASGSEAARNVSHLVLLDSNFDSMPKVVAEGRRVINNVTSVAALFLTKTIFSLLLAIETFITGSYPISTNQLFLIDTLAIGLPSVVLVWEPNNKLISGRFITNVIRKALPGALVILIISIVTFACEDSLNLDSISLSTIIVIAATHTCLMVLYKTCKPFNTLRKFLFGFCYAAFLFFILCLPQFLEFRPIFSWAEYYSSNYQTELVNSYPTVEKSKDNYYVLNGKVSSLSRNPNEKATSITSVLVGDKYYYAINGAATEVAITKPSLSYDNNGNIYFGGYLANRSYSDTFASNIVIDENGYVYYRSTVDSNTYDTPVKITVVGADSYYKIDYDYGNNAETLVNLCVMPTLSFSNNEIVIDGNQTSEYRYMYQSGSAFSSTSVSINPETRELLINGSAIRKTFADGTIDTETYKVSLPNISYDTNGNMYFNAVSSGVTLFDLYGTINNEAGEAVSTVEGLINYFDVDGNPINVSNRVAVVPSTAGYNVLVGDVTVVSDVKLSEASLCMDIDVTSAGYLIINGYYTNFQTNSRGNQMAMKLDNDGYLVVDNIPTSYKVSPKDISKSTGGMVKILNAAEKVFLLMLCLLAGPLMKIFQTMVPWIKKQIKVIQKLLSKF